MPHFLGHLDANVFLNAKTKRFFPLWGFITFSCCLHSLNPGLQIGRQAKYGVVAQLVRAQDS